MLVLKYLYGELLGKTATDSWGSLWHRLMVQKGYILISVDDRGTPALIGRAWRKSVYRKIGVINARNQVMATKAIIKKYAFVDGNRIAVWG